jgi:myosin tail region-interacting protein MTI1
MSSSPSPPKPKPGSLRDRIAAFEQKPASSPAPPPAPRPKPGNLSQWKPRPPSPHDTQPAIDRNDRNDTSMSASDAKESITKGGSLKERMAALQGLGVLGGGPAAPLPPKPAEKPKWKPPPQVAVVPPVAGEDDEADGAEVDNKPAISPLKPPGDDIAGALSKHPQPAPTQDGQSEADGEAPVAGEEVPDPDEEERQRRAAIAARMARLGGMRVGMGPPIFGRKPEIKPKPAVLASETTKEEPIITNVPVAEPALEDDAEHPHAEPQVAADGVYICALCYRVVRSLRVSYSAAPHLAPHQRDFD